MTDTNKTAEEILKDRFHDQVISNIDGEEFWLSEILQDYSDQTTQSLQKELDNAPKLRTYCFDYIQSVHKDNGKWMGSQETAYIEAYCEEHAILKFKDLHPDKKFDAPYF